MAAEAASKTDVLSRIMSTYASTATSSRDSNAMSDCWPSQTSRAVVLNIDNTPANAWEGVPSSASKAKVYMTSPDRMAALSSHFVCTVGRPRRNGASSMMSSCINVKLWNNSTAMAAGMASDTSPPSASHAAKASTGRIRLPPKDNR